MSRATDATARQIAWFDAVGVTLLDIAVGRWRDGIQWWLPPRCDLTHSQVDSLLPWLRHENAHDADVYLRPARAGAWPIVFLDDVATRDALKMARTFSLMTVETSPGRCHVWLRTDRTLDEASRYRVQQALAQQSGTNGPLCDIGSISGEHWGRLAGFVNRKPNRSACWVNLLRAETDQRRYTTATADTPPGPAKSSPRPDRTARSDESRDGSPSGDDWAWVMSKIERGISPTRIEVALAKAAARRGKAHPEEYAARTVANAVAHAEAHMERPLYPLQRS